MTADQAQLKAGGLVPANAKLGKDDVVDAVVARAYQHAVLPGRTVIRLTAENVSAGDDLEMATLGFGAGEDRGIVAKERKRPLGFPGWALVHDPKNARYALDVVKEFKKHARKAKSKPGHAKDGLDAIADKLGKTVPHFLPSFFEEAGRVFIEHGAQTFAAAMFGKAREAEAVHALEVDEQHRVDGFLEFALAGAVTTKALTQYAKELGEHHEPKVAYAHFRQLCLQRTLGGMPPWSGMAKELRRLAKAAKLDIAAEDRGFVVEIIESPALGKAAGEFWRAYAESITELGKHSAAARGALLNLFPTGTAYSKDLDDAWLDLLEATGAVEALLGDTAPPEARPSAGRAGWFDKLTVHLARDYRNAEVGDRAFALLRRMAPALIADGAPIHCTGRYNQVDLDLCELALELGVAVTPPPMHARINLDSWAKRATQPGHGCDPVRTAAHPTMGPLLQAAVGGEIGDEPFDTVSRGKPGFLAAKRSVVEGVISRAEQGALVGLGDAIDLVSTKFKAETFADLPDLHARFAALDPAPALARSIRIGLIDELGWPALEDAGLELNPDGKTTMTLHGGPPAVVLATATRAIAIGAAGRLGTHDLVIPPKHELVTIRFIGGQFLVVIKEGYKARGYWSTAPHDVFDTEVNGWAVGAVATRAAVLGDGAWIEGATPIRLGERKVPEGQTLLACDGTTSWIGEWKDGQHRWREVSASGEAGRYSWPTFIEGAIDPDWKIDAAASVLLPMPGITSSPLGIRDGFVGVRVRYQGTNQHTQTKRELETIDGTRWTGDGYQPSCLLTLPGGGPARPIVEESAWREGVTSTLMDPVANVRGSKVGPKDRRYCRGQVASLAPTFWHHLTPRDPSGSQRLRAFTDADARALIAAIPTEGTPKAVPDQVAGDVLTAVLPEVTHPRLRAGVVGFGMIAAKQLLDRDRLVEERAPGKLAARPVGPSGPDDATLLAGLAGWVDRQWLQEGRAWSQITRTAAMFGSEDRSDRYVHDVAESALDWLGFAVSRSALAFIATAIGTPADKRKAVAELFAEIVRTLPPAEQLRVYTAHGKLELPGEGGGVRIRWWGGNAYLTRKVGWSGEQFRVLEYAPAGAFKPLPGMSCSHELCGAPGLGADAATAVLAAVSEGKTSWSEAAAGALATATGLTPSEATFLWAGAPNASNRGSNFLPKELREELGLKATQAAVARDGLGTIPLDKKLAAIDLAARAGVAALLDGTAVEALAAAWTRIIGKKIAIPEELITDADRELQAPMEPSPALAMIGAARDVPELTVDGTYGLDPNGAVIRVGGIAPLVGQAKLESDAPVFTDRAMHTLLVYLPFLYAELPVGHPLRGQAVVAHELLLQRLTNPALWFEAGYLYLDEAARATIDRVIDGLGGEVVTGLNTGITGRRIPGAVVIRQTHRVELKLQPATLDAKARTLVAPLAAQITQWGNSAWKSLEYLRSPGLAQMIARIRETPVAAGGWEQNPLASVGKLVEKAAKRLGTSKDAAALYLQYLTLLWPTPKNVQQWMGWKAKQFEAANGELVDKELVLEAKRERAQRAHFLPGGWEALKSPHPAMESWKLALYGTRTAAGDPVPPLGRFLALAPFHEMFAAAWQRIEDGDVPRYDEVKR
ncbi:MAG: hypothetical protein IPQ07_08780 [Myxococcales bacterium]|nr:hypothetical protein [Myxococcales bacterium]